MLEKIESDEFLKLSDTYPVLDVRSPGEYVTGHIHGAHSMPLFSNEERAKVGTIYKKSGKDSAVLKGLDYVGPKMSKFVKFARKVAVDNTVMIHCWRGGMRSGSVAWLLSTAGIKVKLLTGGYKAYRRYIRAEFEKYNNLAVLGGMTGSGKTDILDCIESAGEKVVQLEYIASHKGSAFGAMGQNEQPTTEQFENDLYASVSRFDYNDKIWVEDESRSIGRIFMPDVVYDKIRNSVLYFVQVSKKDRIDRLMRDYTEFDNDVLILNVEKISKRLGPQHAKLAIESIETKDYRTAIDIVLSYYDKAYMYGMQKRDTNKVLKICIDEGMSEKEIAELLINYKE